MSSINEALCVLGTQRICTICDGDFDIEGEGGIEGHIGILPVAFCPTCKAGVCDFADQFRPPVDYADDD